MFPEQNPAPAPDNNPAPQPAPDPAPQPAPQPAPVAPEYVPGINPAPAPTPEPAPASAPTPAPEQNPAPAPEQPAPQPTTPAYKNYDEYLDSFVTKAENLPDLPTTEGIKPGDDEALTGFFKNFGEAIEDRAYKRAMADFQTQNSFAQTERGLWDDAFNEYKDLRTNATLRQVVHSVRVAQYNQGNPVTPTEAAKIVIGEIKKAQDGAVAASQTTTRMVESQPAMGGGTPPAQTTVNPQSLESLHQPGQQGVDAAAALIARAMENGEI